MRNTTQTREEIAPVRKSIEIQAPIEVAFRVFTSEMTSWWDLENHHVGEARAVAACLEPRVGGRWFERGEDGTECDWGKVLAWEPPRRLILAWHLNATWQFDPNVHSEVEVRFESTSGGTTRVDLEHRLLEVFGEAAGEVRGSLDSPHGWSHLLARFAAAAAGRAVGS